ncbi:MAG: hypothetical protein QOH90_1878 [Actinomycetota bacterium]|nr:hypothetical protein [Actinomycetota bacterium]
MSDAIEVRPEGRPVSLLPLWWGIAGPPVVWAAQLLISYGAEEVACSAGSSRPDIWGLSVNAIGVIATILALAATVSCGLVARRARLKLRDEADAAVDRSRFMALIGECSAAYFAIVILLTVVGPIAIPSCR